MTSAQTTRGRLKIVIAHDRLKLFSPRLTPGDHITIAIERLIEPCLLLEKFAKVEPMPNYKGQVIKFRERIPFDT